MEAENLFIYNSLWSVIILEHIKFYISDVNLYMYLISRELYKALP